MPTPRPSLVLWDVDHTLIENGGVSKENYASAFKLLMGHVPLRPAATDGRTDVGIMSALLSDNGVAQGRYSVDDQLKALVDAGRANAARLSSRGHALPGAAACLAHLAVDPSVVQSVMTGNVEPNARVKLGAFGLDQWLDWSVGAFGETHKVRGRLVAVSQGKAAKSFGFDPARDVTVVIGDTTLDVEAGLYGGARVLAVATGVSSMDELRAAGADAVLPDLADVNRFAAELRRVIALGSRPRPAHDVAGA